MPTWSMWTSWGRSRLILVPMMDVEFEIVKLLYECILKIILPFVLLKVIAYSRICYKVVIIGQRFCSRLPTDHGSQGPFYFLCFMVALMSSQVTFANIRSVAFLESDGRLSDSFIKLLNFFVTFYYCSIFLWVNSMYDSYDLHGA